MNCLGVALVLVICKQKEKPPDLVFKVGFEPKPQGWSGVDPLQRENKCRSDGGKIKNEQCVQRECIPCEGEGVSYL